MTTDQITATTTPEPADGDTLVLLGPVPQRPGTLEPHTHPSTAHEAAVGP